MYKPGIFTKADFLALGTDRWRVVPYTSYLLLDVGDRPDADDIESFESISFGLRTSNGTFRTTFRNRFENLNAVVMEHMKAMFPADSPLRVEDRAVSNALTSTEWAGVLLEAFPKLQFEASDLVLHFLALTLPGGHTYITEADGTPLQYIHPPFVAPLDHPGARRYFVNRGIAVLARQRLRRANLPEAWKNGTSHSGKNYSVRVVPAFHPEAAALMRRTNQFQLRRRSVFERTLEPVHVIRTMNILNREYFSEKQLAEAARAVFDSLQPGGLWVVGRTLEGDFSNHASFLRRQKDRWEVLPRFGEGSEVEALALQLRA